MRKALCVLLLLLPILALAQRNKVPVADAHTIDAAHLIQPEELVRVLHGPARNQPLIFMVGFRTMYQTRRIPGAEYTGAAAEQAGLQQLRERVRNVPKKQPIVLYCGCCPWPHCPNVDPAFAELKSLGFSNVKVLYIANNFGKDWIEKGYPVDR